MKIYISIVKNADDSLDVEVLDDEPTESFRDGLNYLFDNDEIQWYEIREGFLNGGDSLVIWSS